MNLSIQDIENLCYNYLKGNILKYAKISVIIEKAIPPFFLGSQLRGAFGYALKRVVCINPSFKCNECFAKDNCLYYQFYEKKNVYHKYRFDYELGKSYYDFSIYLFDDSIPKLPYVVSALYQMITKIGFGKDRKTYTKFDMFVNDSHIFKNSEIVLPKNYEKEFKIDTFGPNILVRFVTPLRMKKNNSFIRSKELELKDLIDSICKRESKLQENELKKLEFKPKGEIIKRDINFLDLSRYSNRQKTKLKIGGLIGEVEIKDIDEKSYKLLKLGEIVGIGKQTAFGLGKIKVINKS